MDRSKTKKRHGNNPLSDRFDHVPPPEKGRFPRVAFVMQGGGALGAYQYGVVRGLFEAGYEPNWIAATSIGAIQAAIIVGNPPEKRLEKLEEFWSRIAPESWFSSLFEPYLTTNQNNKLNAGFALFSGQPDFFYPRWWDGVMNPTGEPDTLSFYNTSPLKKTLLELIDFDLLNSVPIRLSLGAVQISTGHLIYFNNINYRIEVEHVLASGALPPGFPAVHIDREYYWDGGIHSNTPLEVILEAIPPENTLCFLIDCFGGCPYVPNNFYEISERMKDIRYSTHAQRTILNYIQRQSTRDVIQALCQQMTEQQRKACTENLNIISPHHTTLVHINFSARFDKTASKDYNFGRSVIEQRIATGYQDVQAMLEEEKHWGYLPKDKKTHLYEAPNNHSKLLRKE